MKNEQNKEQRMIGVDNTPKEEFQDPQGNRNVGSITDYWEEEECDSHRITFGRVFMWILAIIPVLIGAIFCSYPYYHLFMYYCWGLVFLALLPLDIVVRDANTYVILVLSFRSYFFVIFSSFVGVDGAYFLVVFLLLVFLACDYFLRQSNIYQNISFSFPFSTKNIKLVIIATIAVELLSMTIVDGFPNLEMSVGLLVVAVSTLFASTPKRLKTVAIVWYILPLIFSCWQIIDYHRWEAISQWNPLLWPINTILPILCRIATFNTLPSSTSSTAPTAHPEK